MAAYFETLALLALPRNSSEFLVDMTKNLALGGKLSTNGQENHFMGFKIRVYLCKFKCVYPVLVIG